MPRFAVVLVLFAVSASADAAFAKGGTTSVPLRPFQHFAADIAE